MSDHWQFLGIAPTEDMLAIKRAYAALLKQNNPQTDPEGFQRLRAAYEAALWDARRAAESQEQNDEPPPANGPEGGSESDGVPAQQAVAENATAPQEPPPHIQEALREAQRLLDAMRDILLSEKRRSKIGEWEAVLRDPALDNMDVRLRLSFGFLEYVCQAVADDSSLQLPIVWMPHEIWQRLDKVFGWTEMELELHRYYPAEWLQFFIGRLHEAYGREAVQMLPPPAPARKRWLKDHRAFWIVIVTIFLLGPLLRLLSK